MFALFLSVTESRRKTRREMATNLECSDSIRGHVIDDGEKLRLLEAVVEQQDDELLESVE